MVFPCIPIKVFHGRMDVLIGYDVLDRYCRHWWHV